MEPKGHITGCFPTLKVSPKGVIRPLIFCGQPLLKYVFITSKFQRHEVGKNNGHIGHNRLTERLTQSRDKNWTILT